MLTTEVNQNLDVRSCCKAGGFDAAAQALGGATTTHRHKAAWTAFFLRGLFLDVDGRPYHAPTQLQQRLGGYQS